MGDVVTNTVLFTVGAVGLLIGWGYWNTDIKPGVQDHTELCVCTPGRHYWDKNIRPGVQAQVNNVAEPIGGTPVAGR